MYQALQEYRPLDPSKVRLTKAAGKTDGLCLTVDGPHGRAAYEGVTVRKAFPLSADDRLLTFADRAGREIGVLDDPQWLDAASQAALAAELSIAYYVPRIRQVVSLKEQYGLRHWDVETDRGRRRFATQSRSDVRLLEGGRLVIRDVDGNRYEIEDLAALDRASLAKLDFEL